MVIFATSFKLSISGSFFHCINQTNVEHKHDSITCSSRLPRDMACEYKSRNYNPSPHISIITSHTPRTPHQGFQAFVSFNPPFSTYFPLFILYFSHLHSSIIVLEAIQNQQAIIFPSTKPKPCTSLHHHLLQAAAPPPSPPSLEASLVIDIF